MLTVTIPVRDWIIRCLDDGSRCQLYLACSYVADDDAWIFRRQYFIWVARALDVMARLLQSRAQILRDLYPGRVPRDIDDCRPSFMGRTSLTPDRLR